MAPEVQANVEKILEDKIHFVSTNLGLNMLISKLKRRVAEDPSSLSACVEEIDTFLSKYQSMMAGEVTKLAAL